MGGHDAVIMLVVFGLLGDDVDGGKPLDHPSPDVSNDDGADREAMIGLENIDVGPVGDEDVVGCIHGPGKGDGNDVLFELSPGILLEGYGPDLVGEVLNTDELDVLAGHDLYETPALRSRYCPSTPCPQSSWPGRLDLSRNNRGGAD